VLFKDESADENFTIYKSPGTAQSPAELFQESDSIEISEIHKLNNAALLKELMVLPI
jgi:hypothetical protein